LNWCKSFSYILLTSGTYAQLLLIIKDKQSIDPCWTGIHLILIILLISLNINFFLTLLSFKNAVEKEYKNENKINWVIELINNTIIEFDIEMIEEAKNKINNYGFYPFWKNELMANAIIKEYIENE